MRAAAERDKGEIFRLLQLAPYRHIHVDWHAPADWIGTPEFVVVEGTDDRGEQGILACLATAADPPPAAWVRLAAVQSGQQPEGLLEVMLQAVLPHLKSAGLNELGWFPVRLWPELWLSNLGFNKVNRIATYIKDGTDLPELPDKCISIRPAEVKDMRALAAIEEDAFEPLWRHSSQGLRLALRQAYSFDLAEFDGQIVGFQYSVEGQNRESVHLVRITVSRDRQGQGIGSKLMATAIQGYRRRSIRQVTLNTQVDNTSSHRLYKRFGFRRLEDELPVWAMAL